MCELIKALMTVEKCTFERETCFAWNYLMLFYFVVQSNIKIYWENVKNYAE